MAIVGLLDSDWVRQSFLVDALNLTAIETRNRFFTSASLKYVDTSPGANVMINPPPQFTRLADVKPVSIRGYGSARMGKNQGIHSNYSYDTALGRYYSEAIDDNAHLVHFRMGKTAYSSFFRFFTGYYSFKAAHLARTGRVPGFFYQLGRIAGFLVSIVNFRVFATVLTLRTIQFLGAGANFLSGVPRSKYAYLKPTMPIYWAAVQSMVNNIANYMGFVTAPAGGPKEKGNIGVNEEHQDYGFEFDNNLKAAMASKFPDIFDKDGNLNVYAFASKGQRLANANRKRVMEGLEHNANYKDTNAQIVNFYRDSISNRSMIMSFENYMATWMNQGMFGFLGSMLGLFSDDDKSLFTDGGNMGKFLEAEMNDGTAFVTFRVDEGGSISESFSNSATDSEMKGMLDGMSANIRSKFESFSGGNIGDGVIAQALEKGISSVQQFAAGALESFGLGGLAGLGSSSYADIPQHWESSQGQMPRANYTIKLNSPYANPVSKFIHEIVPLCMILCMGLPHGTGPASYSAPFMLEFYDRGRAQCRYGMIDSISITRGTASTPFSQDRMYNGIEVNISILDLTSSLYMPLSTGSSITDSTTGLIASLVGASAASSLGNIGSTASTDTTAAESGASATGMLFGGAKTAVDTLENIFADDSNYTDYLSILAGVGLADNIYAMRKLRRRLAIATSEWKTQYSVPAIAMAWGDSFPMYKAKAIYRGSDKAF